MPETSPVMRLLHQRREQAQTGNRLPMRKRLPAPVRRVGRSVLKMLHRKRLERIAAATRLLGTTRIVRRVSEFRGVFELDTRSTVTQSILFGGFEYSFAELFEAILTPGQDLVDVGANVGLFTVLGSSLIGGGRVLAVEPAPTILPLLRANIAKNGLKNIELFEGVATSQSGPCSLISIEGSEEFSSLGEIAHPIAPSTARKTIEVPGETLDHLVSMHNLRPAVIKIDVEGAEAFVFRGATNVLEQFRPIILSELDCRLMKHLGATPEDVRTLLTERRYCLFDAATGRDLSEDASLANYIGEIVCVPDEQAF